MDRQSRTNKSDLIAYLGSRGMKQADANSVLQMISAFVSDKISDGTEVILPDIGILKIARTKEKKGRNLKTGESMTIPPSIKLKFLPAKILRDKLETL